MRAINERTILELIRDAGTLSRSQMASRSGLSKPTVSQALVGLGEAGLVLERGRSSGRKGPGATLYALNPRAGFVVGIDVGRNWVRAALADITGAVIARRQERAANSRRIAFQIGALAAGLAADAGIERSQMTHATVGISGVFDPARGALDLAPNLPGSRRTGFADAIRDRLGIETSFENDVNLAALGESWRGAGQGVANFVFLWVGTGVGPGHRDRRRALPRRLRGGRRDRLHPGWGRRSRTIPTIAAAVRSRRRPGPARSSSWPASWAWPRRSRSSRSSPRPAPAIPTANRVVELEAGRIALAIAAVAPILDPELVILGGGIAAGGADLLADAAARELGRLSPFRPRLVGSNLGDDAVVHGALATALQAAQEQVFNRSPHPDGREIVV